MQHTTTQPRIAAITQQPVINTSLFFIALAAFGVVDILAGVISLVSAIIPILSTSMLTLASMNVTDAVFELFLGGLILASSRVFNKGNSLAIWIYGASIIIDILYKFLMGYPLNYVFISFGLLLIWQMLKFRHQWEVL